MVFPGPLIFVKLVGMLWYLIVLLCIAQITSSPEHYYICLFFTSGFSSLECLLFSWPYFHWVPCIRVTWTQALQYQGNQLGNEMATNWLMRRQHIQCRYDGQRGDSCPRQDGCVSMKFNCIIKNGFPKMVACLCLTISRVIYRFWISVLCNLCVHRL